VCPECCEQARARTQHLTRNPPMAQLETNAVSTHEFTDYQILEDWNDD
jgi:hypothetical protein